MINEEAGGDDQRAKLPRTDYVYASQGYGKSARGVMLADVSQGDLILGLEWPVVLKTISLITHRFPRAGQVRSGE